MRAVLRFVDEDVEDATALPPRGLGWRRLLLAPVVAAVALLLPWSTSPANAYGVAVPVTPIISLLGTAGTELGTYMTLATGLLADPFTPVATGAGAYQGTCWIAGAMFSGDACTFSDIPSTADSIWNLLTKGSWYGTPAVYTGPSALIGHSAYAGPSTPFSMTLFNANYGFGNFVLTYQYTSGSSAYSAGAQCRVEIDKATGSAQNSVTVENGNSPQSALAINTGGGFTATVSQGLSQCTDSNAKALVEVQAFTGCCTLAADWKTGASGSTPYTATFTETCQTSTGSTFTRSTTVSWTPATGNKSPDAHLPNCWDITPGSVRTQVGVSAGPTGGSAVTSGTIPTADPKYAACVSTMCAVSPLYVPTGTKCFSSATDTSAAQDCVDQWPDANDNKNDWQCWYGGYRIALSTCLGMYPAPYFGTGITTVTSPSPSPSPSVSTSPSAPVLPTTGTNPESPPQGDPAGDPQGSGCWGSGWSWNPVSWVYVPVKCALKWAFIPTTAPSFGDIPSPLPAGWIPTFPSLSDGSCGALTMPSLDLGRLLPATGSRTLLNTCNAPWPLLRTFTYYGLLAGALVTVGNRGFRAVTTSLGMGVDTPAAGGDE